MSNKLLRIGLIASLLAVFGLLVTNTTSASAHTQDGTSKSVTNCLGSAAFPLNDLCVTTNYTVYSSSNEQISSVEGCVDVQGPATYAVIKTQVDVKDQGSTTWTKNDQTLIYGPVGFETNKCVWYWPWKSVTPGNNDAVFTAVGNVCVNPLKNDGFGCQPGDTSSYTPINENVDTSNFS